MRKGSAFPHIGPNTNPLGWAACRKAAGFPHIKRRSRGGCEHFHNFRGLEHFEVAPAYQYNFNANCMIRGGKLLPKIPPKDGPSDGFVSGVENEGVLVALNISQRNWTR